MAENSHVVHLQSSQKEMAVDALTRAFKDDVAYRYVLPDESERLLATRRLWTALIDYCYLFGEIYTTPEVSGIACWLPPESSKYTFWKMIRSGFALPRAIMSMKQPARDRMSAAMKFNDDVHNRLMQRPHWYLGALGIHPAHQRKGIGSLLLQPVLARSDEKDIPCYLETETEGNVSFYRKHGFEVANEALVPGHEMRIWAMIREPRR